MKDKKPKFTCVRCQSVVFRIGKDCNSEAKLCGKCKGAQKAFSPRVTCYDEQGPTIPQKIAEIRARCDRAEQLHKQYPNKIFIELWNLTKEIRCE